MNLKTLELKTLNTKNVLMLVGSVLLCEAVGVTGIFLNKLAMTDMSLIWYDILFKPALNPSSEVYVSIWAVMYLLMGVALFMVLNSDNQHGKKSALVVFGFSLLLSVLIVPVFFAFESALGGFIIAILLWLSLFLCFYKFYKVRMYASVFIGPAIIWVSHLMGLTLTYWLVNDLHWLMP